MYILNLIAVVLIKIPFIITRNYQSNKRKFDLEKSYHLFQQINSPPDPKGIQQHQNVLNGRVANHCCALLISNDIREPPKIHVVIFSGFFAYKSRKRTTSKDSLTFWPPIWSNVLSLSFEQKWKRRTTLC